jgi:hypothetical protein
MNQYIEKVNPGIKILFGSLLCLLAIACGANFSLIGDVGPEKYIIAVFGIIFGLGGAIMLASGIVSEQW